MPGEFECKECGKRFTLADSVLAKYPGWTPRTCLRCRDGKKSGGRANGKRSRSNAGGGQTLLTLSQVLERYHDGPKQGIFTDGSCSPNPGPGGWGVVYVVDNQVVDQRHGHDQNTTNNRMELTALINGYQMAPAGIPTEIYTDSELCVKTLTQWAPGWKARGWRRKAGPIKNLDLVQELYALYVARPKLRLEWIRAHAGQRWNEYADALASAYLRSEL